jgi:hypothetical protein
MPDQVLRKREAESLSRKTCTFGCVFRMEAGWRGDTAAFSDKQLNTASAFRFSGTIARIQAVFMICLMDMENA